MTISSEKIITQWINYFFKVSQMDILLIKRFQELLMDFKLENTLNKFLEIMWKYTKIHEFFYNLQNFTIH